MFSLALTCNFSIFARASELRYHRGSTIPSCRKWRSALHLNRLIFSILVALLLFPSAAVTQAAEFTVFLVRHAEKADTSRDSELSKVGQLRAKNLAKVLKDAEIEYVHSTDFRRTKATAAPISKQANLRLRIYSPRALKELVTLIRSQKGRHLVVGHTNTVPKTAQLLGGDPGFPIDESNEFDRLYVINMSADGKVTTVLLRY